MIPCNELPPREMLEHLLSPEFDDAYEADTPTLLAAQANTASLLAQLSAADHVLDEDAAHLARNAFSAVTSPNTSPTQANAAILKLRTPQAVQHLAGMLAQYDWDFIEQAKELRGYVVAKLLEETKHPDAKVRLKSLELVGKLTEVASFTERSEVTIKHENAEDVEDRLRARLKSLLPPQQAIQDVEVQEIAVVKHEIPLS